MSVFYEPGRYRCEVLQQAMITASTGTPQFVLKVEVVGRYTAPDKLDGVRANYERTIYMALTEKRMKYVAKELAALGFTGSSLKYLDPKTPNYEDFTGQPLDCICSHEPAQNGEDKERWSIAWGREESKPLEGGTVAPAEYRQLDALFNAANKATGKPAAVKPKPVAVPKNQSVDDDLPF